MRNLMTLLALTVLLLGGCATLPDNSQRRESYALEHTDNTRIGRDLAALKQQHPEKSGAFPLESGLDAFVARAVLAAVAEKKISMFSITCITTITLELCLPPSC